MKTKTIALDSEAYELLRDHRREGETFSDVVKRLARRGRPLSDFAGAWRELPKRDLELIVTAINRGRRGDEERLIQLIRRMR